MNTVRLGNTHIQQPLRLICPSAAAQLNSAGQLRLPSRAAAHHPCVRGPSFAYSSMAKGDTGPPTAGTGAVFPEQYDEQLAAKIARVRELMGGQKLPDIEVFRSAPSNFRMRTEFRVWLQGEDVYYVMFEKNEGSSSQAGAAVEPTTAPALPKEADGGDTAEPTAAAPAQEQQQQPSSSTQPKKQHKRHRGKAGRKVSQAAAADGEAGADDAAAAAARRRFTRVRIDDFPVASSLICAIMPLLRQELIAHSVLRDKIFQANFHTTLSKQAMITLAYHKTLDDVWQEAAQGLRARLLKALGPEQCAALHVVGRSRKQKVALEADHVVEQMEVAGRTYEYMQVEGGFSQPNGGVCQHMLSWAVDVTKGSSGDLLELYCGNGNFTIPLAQNFKQVVATEVSKASVAAARHNMAANNVSNIFMARMSSEEFTETWKVKGTRHRLAGLDWEQLSLQTLFVDPPRAGLDPATEQLLQDFQQVVYISCNPETLAQNLKSVVHSHDIVRFAVFDQFPYTHHLECGAFLVKKQS